MPKERKVHPAAEIFPMMANDQLEDLAADIKANGLGSPIVTSNDGETIIDGRNRLAACKLAGVRPTFAKINGHDPLALILSANIAQRRMSKGQQAMAVAMMYPQAKHGGDRKSKSSGLKRLDAPVGKAMLSRARTVLANAPELARNVLDGSKSLYDAYAIVQRRLAEASVLDTD
jgi:hypothetical protein